MIRYIGIDLAWGERATTAVVVLQGMGNTPQAGAQLLDVAEGLTDDDSILAFVRRYNSPSGMVVGIDAPTLVPNQMGCRPCESVLSRCLRRYHAGTHPANRNLLATNGVVRGERLVKRLEELNIAHTPYPQKAPDVTRVCFEVFPHAAHISLFGLQRILSYKSKPKRTKETRCEAFRCYVRLLESLRTANPPLYLPEEISGWLRRDPAEMRTKALKQHEDALDALTCAYVALYRLAKGAEYCPAVGDLETGFIVTPATPEILVCFRDTAPQYGITVS